MTREHVGSRVLGALQLVDATTGMPVRRRLGVRSDSAVLRQNGSGLYVVWSAAGLEAHGDAFEAPPAAPAVGSVHADVIVDDPEREYLTRRFRLALPRDPAPDAADSVLVPVPVTLFPSSIARVGPGWAVVRASVREAVTERGIPGALLRVRLTGGVSIWARGLTDARGEALVMVPGIPIVTWEGEAEESVLGTELAATIEVAADRASLDTDASGRLVRREPADPDDLDRRFDTLDRASAEARLSSGGHLATTIHLVFS